MSETAAVADGRKTGKAPSMGKFERFLTLWVMLCIIVGIGLGQAMPGVFHALGAATVAQVNLPVAVLVWLMIVPMLLKIDLAALGQVRNHWRGIVTTVVVNWLVKPFRWRCSAGCSSPICSGRSCLPIRSTAILPG
jgi:ACR3 family arsenite transporter